MEAALKDLVRTIWRIYLGRLDDYVFLFQRIEFADNGCWIFTGNRGGGERAYGVARLDGKKEMAHRVAWRLLVGPIPPGWEIDHECPAKLCCNPAHLVPRSRDDHLARHGGGWFHRHQKMRQQTHCKRGHEFTPENTKLVDGSRHCRKCSSLRVIQSRDRHRDAFNEYRRKRYWQDPDKARAEAAKYQRACQRRKRERAQEETGDQASLPLDET